jgi:hypothetical protein
MMSAEPEEDKEEAPALPQPAVAVVVEPSYAYPPPPLAAGGGGYPPPHGGYVTSSMAIPVAAAYHGHQQQPAGSAAYYGHEQQPAAAAYAAPGATQTAIPRLDPQDVQVVRRHHPAPEPAHPPLMRQVGEGRFTIVTPLPCWAYVFMIPFPFFCMGCCLFGGSSATFDDTTLEVTAKRWKGVFSCCPKEQRVIPYRSIANVVIFHTNVSVNRVTQMGWGLLLTDGSVFKVNSSGSFPGVTERHALEVHAFIFGRANPNYRPPQPFSLRAVL